MPMDSVSLPYAVVDGVLLHHATLAAHEIGLFSALAAGPLAIEELAARLDLSERVVRLLAGAAGSFGVTTRLDERVALTPAGRAAVLRENGEPSALFGLGVHLVRERYGYERLLSAVREDGERSNPFAGDWFGIEPESFAGMMDEHALPVATRWPDVVDVSGHRRLLDVGGAHGTHAVAAVRSAPDLKAVILELPALAGSAWLAVQRTGLADRVDVVAGDMWRSPWPDADLHLLADVLHDWRPDEARRLVARSFEALPPGGRLVALEMPLASDRTGPAEVVASGLAMLLLTGGQQYSVAELESFLLEAGFVDVTTRPVVGPWQATVGRKP